MSYLENNIKDAIINGNNFFDAPGTDTIDESIYYDIPAKDSYVVKRSNGSLDRNNIVIVVSSHQEYIPLPAIRSKPTALGTMFYKELPVNTLVFTKSYYGSTTTIRQSFLVNSWRRNSYQFNSMDFMNGNIVNYIVFPGMMLSFISAKVNPVQNSYAFPMIVIVMPRSVYYEGIKEPSDIVKKMQCWVYKELDIPHTPFPRIRNFYRRHLKNPIIESGIPIINKSSVEMRSLLQDPGRDDYDKEEIIPEAIRTLQNRTSI